MANMLYNPINLNKIHTTLVLSKINHKPFIHFKTTTSASANFLKFWQNAERKGRHVGAAYFREGGKRMGGG